MEEEYTEYLIKIKKNYSKKNNNSSDEIRKRIELNRKEYLEVFKKEYEFEKLKKQSFENRAGILLTLITGLFTFLIKDLEISNDFINLFKTKNLTLFSFLKFLDTIAIYISFGFTGYYLLRIISIKQHDIYDVNSQIDYQEPYATILNDLLFNFNEIINSHRNNNEKRAKDFKQSLISLVLAIIFLFFYSFLKEVE